MYYASKWWLSGISLLTVPIPSGIWSYCIWLKPAEPHERISPSCSISQRLLSLSLLLLCSTGRSSLLALWIGWSWFRVTKISRRIVWRKSDNLRTVLSLSTRNSASSRWWGTWWSSRCSSACCSWLLRSFLCCHSSCRPWVTSQRVRNTCSQSFCW